MAKVSAPGQPDTALVSLATPIEVGDLPHEVRDLVVVLLALISSLQFEVLSGDLWALAIYRAIDDAQRMGVPPETFAAIYRKLEAHRKSQRDRNPLSGMF